MTTWQQNSHDLIYLVQFNDRDESHTDPLESKVQQSVRAAFPTL